MTDQDMEAVYDALAARIDAIDPADLEVFLTKLALLLSKQLDDAQTVLDSIGSAAQNLPSKINHPVREDA